MKTPAQKVLESSRRRAELDKMPAPTSYICDGCGRELKPGAMANRYAALETLTWRGTCVECWNKAFRERQKNHKCGISNVSLYGVCKICGTVQPGSPLDKFHEATREFDDNDPAYGRYIAILKQDAHAEMYRRGIEQNRRRRILMDVRRKKIPLSDAVKLILG